MGCVPDRTVSRDRTLRVTHHVYVRGLERAVGEVTDAVLAAIALVVVTQLTESV